MTSGDLCGALYAIDWFLQFMKYMKQVGDGEIHLEETEQEAESWSDEYLNVAAKKDSELLAQNWANEHTSSIGKILDSLKNRSAVIN